MMDVDRFAAVIDRGVAVFLSAAEKVIRNDPTWPEFLMLLDEDEQLAFWSFVAATRGEREVMG